MLELIATSTDSFLAKEEKTLKTLLKRSASLLSLITCASAYLALPASADSTADLLLSLKCPNDYTVTVWQRHNSGELLYTAFSPLGELKLGKGTLDGTGAAQVYKLKNGDYEYIALGGTRDHQERGTLTVFKNNRSILSQSCTREV